MAVSFAAAREITQHAYVIVRYITCVHISNRHQYTLVRFHVFMADVSLETTISRFRCRKCRITLFSSKHLYSHASIDENDTTLKLNDDQSLDHDEVDISSFEKCSSWFLRDESELSWVTENIEEVCLGLCSKLPILRTHRGHKLNYQVPLFSSHFHGLAFIDYNIETLLLHSFLSSHIKRTSIY